MTQAYNTTGLLGGGYQTEKLIKQERVKISEAKWANFRVTKALGVPKSNVEKIFPTIFPSSYNIDELMEHFDLLIRLLVLVAFGL
jgi:hypothetical protein